MPYSFCFSVFPVPSLRADGISDKALLCLFSQLPNGNVGVAGQTFAFSLRPGTPFLTAKELAQFCNSLFSYYGQIPFTADKRKWILLVFLTPNVELRGRPNRRDNAKQRRFGLS